MTSIEMAEPPTSSSSTSAQPEQTDALSMLPLAAGAAAELGLDAPAKDSQDDMGREFYEYVILVDDVNKTGAKAEARLAKVAQMVSGLTAVGLLVSRRVDESKEAIYFLVGANQKLLETHAEEMGLEVPLTQDHGGAHAKFIVNKRQFFEPFTITHRQRVIANLIEADIDLGGAEISLGKLQKAGTITKFYALHDPAVQQELWKNWVLMKPWARQPLKLVRDYFGEEISFYFAWLGYYTLWLAWAAPLGVILFLTGIRWGGYYDKGWSATVYSFFIAAWAALFLEFWKRNSNKLAFQWNMMEFEDVERTRPEYEGQDLPGVWSLGTFVDLSHEPNAQKVKPIKYYPPIKTNAKLVIAFSLLSTGVMLVMVVAISIISFRLFVQKKLVAASPAHASVMATLGGVLVSILNAMLIIILNKVYVFIATILTDWENHRTVQMYQTFLSIKIFLFTFANSFTGLFYIAYIKRGTRLWGVEYLHDSCNQQYLSSDVASSSTNLPLWQGCSNELTQQLASLLLFNLVVGQAMEIFFPALGTTLGQFAFFRRKAEAEVRGGTMTWLPRQVKHFYHFVRANISKKKKMNYEKLPEHELQGTLAPHADLIGEYAEMIIQFGYVTLFAASFPLAPLIALVNNVIEMRTDASKFVRLLNKPDYVGANGIGIWYWILQGVALLAVMNNCLLIGFLYNPIKDVITDTMDNDGSKPETFRVLYSVLWFIVILEHGILFLKVIIGYFIPDMPASVKLGLAKSFWQKEVQLQDSELLQAKRDKQADTTRLRAQAEMASLMSDIKPSADV